MRGKEELAIICLGILSSSMKKRRVFNEDGRGKKGFGNEIYISKK